MNSTEQWPRGNPHLGGHFLNVVHVAELPTGDDEGFGITVSRHETDKIHPRIENHPTHHSLSLSYALIIH